MAMVLHRVWLEKRRNGPDEGGTCNPWRWSPLPCHRSVNFELRQGRFDQAVDLSAYVFRMMEHPYLDSQAWRDTGIGHACPHFIARSRNVR
jgi:hypothetical protein